MDEMIWISKAMTAPYITCSDHIPITGREPVTFIHFKKHEFTAQEIESSFELRYLLGKMELGISIEVTPII